MSTAEQDQEAPANKSLWLAILPLAGLMVMLLFDAFINHLLLGKEHDWEQAFFWPAFACTLIGGGAAILRGFSPTTYSWITLGTIAVIYMSFPVHDWDAPKSWAGALVTLLLGAGFVRTFLRGWRHAAFWSILLSSQACLITAIDVGHDAHTILWFSGVSILTIILGYITYNYYHNLHNPGIYLWIIGMVLLNTLVLAFVDGQLHALNPNRSNDFFQRVLLINAILIVMPSLSWAYQRLLGRKTD